MESAKRILLLDLGGVLADLGDPVAAMGLDLSPDAFWATWLNSSDVHAFEIGALESAEFCRKIARELGQSDDEGFETRFRAWQLQLFPDAEDFVRFASEHYRLALLSNTNEVHWQQIVESTQMFSGFEKTFLSFETGHYKPATESYRQVMAHFDCEPGDVLFLDDAPRNILAAQQERIVAHRVCGIEQARAVVANDLGIRHEN